MVHSYINLRNIEFLLFDVHDIPALNRLPYFADYDRDSMQMALQTAKQLADRYLYPAFREMDRDKARYEQGEVVVHPAVREAIQALGEGGWIAAGADYGLGGQQMPLALQSACNVVFHAANANITAYALLTQSAANLINSFGSEELQQYYTARMFSGEWQGTMALTEPQAGSSLSDITTAAVPTDREGVYHILGQKIYISGGDYRDTENIVHLLLARIEGAPAGTRGISLFVVPKYRPDGKDGLQDNHVTTAGLYGKMGQKGYVAAHLMFGEQGPTEGYLVGESEQGLKYMFRMMNEARLGTGLMATGTATAAYYASLQYARERPQGRHPSSKDVSQPQIPIIEHADVKRMLLYQKSVTEGSLSLNIQCSRYADLAHYGEREEARRAYLLLELLTPVAKSFPSEMGTHSVSMGMQVLGGAGYTDDFPLEQYYRDIRVNSIYEGTTTIHGMDLLGRKLMMQEGGALQLLRAEMEDTLAAARRRPELQDLAAQLTDSLAEMQEVIRHLSGVAVQYGPEAYLADATLFLEYFGLQVIAWQWLKQTLPVLGREEQDDFARGKLAACRYFFAYELSRSCGLRTRLLSDDRITLNTPVDAIN